MIVLAALLLAGCSETTVYIPEEEIKLQGGTVVQIPVRPTEETEEAQTEITAPAEPEETEPEMTNSASITKKPSASSNKGNTSNKNPSTNSGTITGSAKPQETKPAATEPEEQKNQATVTIPAVTEPAATEPDPTENPVTEPPETEPPVYDISGYVTGALEYAMLDRINTHRGEAALAELTMDETLCAIASCRSYEVSLVWSHTRPDGRYFATVLDDYGYGAGAAEELLVYALGFADGTAMVDRWIQSDAHRQLLLGRWSAAGIGVYDADGYIYVTCLLIG